MANTAHFAINDISMHWDELPRRAEKPCAECGHLTKGRMTNVGGIVTPAHCGCAVAYTIDKAMKVYVPKGAR